MNNMDELLIHNAEEKLKAGRKSKDTSDIATILQDYVIEALTDFCRQEPKIAEAIIKSDKSIYDCCKEITKDTKPERHISDFKAYGRALKFYMPEMDIECHMTVKVKDKPENSLKLSLFDLME